MRSPSRYCLKTRPIAASRSSTQTELGERWNSNTKVVVWPDFFWLCLALGVERVPCFALRGSPLEGPWCVCRSSPMHRALCVPCRPIPGRVRGSTTAFHFLMPALRSFREDRMGKDLGSPGLLASRRSHMSYYALCPPPLSASNTRILSSFSSSTLVTQPFPRFRASSPPVVVLGLPGPAEYGHGGGRIELCRVDVCAMVPRSRER
jgi:hypothetical protein